MCCPCAFIHARVSVWGAIYNLPGCGVFLCLLPKQRFFCITKLRSEYKKDVHPQNQARKRIHKFPFQAMLEPSRLFPTTPSIPNQKRLSNSPEGGRYKQIGFSGVISLPFFAIRYAHSEDRHQATRTPSGGQKDWWSLLHHRTKWAFHEERRAIGNIRGGRAQRVGGQGQIGALAEQV